MAVPTDRDEVGGYLEASGGDSPATLGDLQTPLRMSRTAWLIAAMIFVAALSFFIVVVCLGVDNS
ncbi:MAG TPA: hypothetical protein VNH38_03360 [Candidatus Dormibacteraeota bacterium]|nr:hypothetical protein [Candidatus Dormibacteraeota bacterium]